MRLLEYESKEILKEYGIPVPTGQTVSRSKDLQMEGPVVLKAQIPIGGRGKTGGIIEAERREEARSGIEHLLSTEIRGYRPKKILVEEKIAASFRRKGV